MNQSFGGKKGRVASSSDLLRAVRISVQTGANASYKNDPKKTRAAGDSSGEVLGRSIMPGLFTELSTLVGTVNPYIPPPPPVPLTFVTQYMIAMFPNLVNQPIVVFSGDGNLYVVGDANNGTGSSILYRVAPNGIYGQVGTINMSTKAAIIGNDGYMYIVGGKGIVKCSPTDGSYTYVATTGIVSPKGITQSPITDVLYVTSGTQVLSISNGQIDQITIGKTCIGIVYATDGYLYVSTAEGGIYRVNPQNRTFVPYIATSRNFYTLIQANDGLLYGTIYGLGVYRITPSNGVIEQFAPPLSGTAFFYGITQSSDESLYVTAKNVDTELFVYRIQVNNTVVSTFQFTERSGNSGLPARGETSFRSVASSADGTRLIVCAYIAIYISVNSGNTWTQSTAGIDNVSELSSAALTSDGMTAFLLGFDRTGSSVIWKSSDGGISWRRITIDKFQNLRWDGIACNLKGDGFFAIYSTYDGIVGGYSRQDGGDFYTNAGEVLQISQASNLQSIAVASDTNDIVVCTYSGNVYLSYSPKNGIQWVDVTPNVSLPNWYAVAISSDGMTLTVGGTRGVYRSLDQGLSWSQILGSETIYSLALSYDGTRIVAVAQDNRVLISYDSGTTWETIVPAAFNLQTSQWSQISANVDCTKLAVIDSGAGVLSTLQ